MIKAWLKQFDAAREINSRLKARQAVSRYRRTVAHYSALDEAPISDAWRARAQVLSRSPKGRDLRIFFVGTDEQQDKSGFLQALERLGDVRCFVREDGSWGQNDPAPYQQRRERNTLRLEQLFADNASEGWVPQLLIAQTWGCLIEPACFSRLRDRYGVFVVNIAMDDRHQYWGSKVAGMWDGTYPLIPHIDLTLTAAPEAVGWYRKEGGVALYFPEASDPEIFHPMPDLPKIHDVSFVGVRYGIRERIVNALRQAGVSVSAYGTGWEGGRIANENVPKLFAQSKIVLGVGTIGHCDDFFALKLRDFDAPMSGSCYLTHDNSDLHHLYDVGTEIATYTCVDDCVEKARSMLSDKVRINLIGEAARRRACRDHSWDRRLSDLLSSLETLSGIQG
ncbi:MAG: glycosyltransferase [Gammaproteobacteria bacterium]|nr:glycosyltransferase [Gammaproteobacteria bacterium]MBU1647636.1 glycosyltransferase [Gammaproteobacteria bacterium]MBU1971524.1 glycosyltransferase [Gammaproteobacteria bacterium]